MTEMHTLSMKVIVSDTVASCSSSADNQLLKVFEPYVGAVFPQLMCSMHNQAKQLMHMQALKKRSELKH